MTNEKSFDFWDLLIVKFKSGLLHIVWKQKCEISYTSYTCCLLFFTQQFLPELSAIYVKVHFGLKKAEKY